MICHQSELRSTLKYKGRTINKPTWCLLQAKELEKWGHLYHISSTQNWKIFVKNLQYQCITQTTPTGPRLSAIVVRTKLKLMPLETQGASAFNSS